MRTDRKIKELASQFLYPACFTVAQVASHHFFETPLAGGPGASGLLPTASLQAGRIRTRPGSTIARRPASLSNIGLFWANNRTASATALAVA